MYCTFSIIGNKEDFDFAFSRLYPASSLLLDHPGSPTSGSQLSNPCLPAVPERLKELNL